MTDKFSIIPLAKLLQIILTQYRNTKSIFGIPEELFFKPDLKDDFRFLRFDQLMENPIGVAAGPHTQLAQNIVASWLTGARYIELKTIQTLDQLELSKPCIDMQDEGYNCEWSQELKISESFDQYLNAWILIHILKHELKIGIPDSPGFIFNMSVGYNLEGILKENVQWFLNKMADATPELQTKINSIKAIYSDIDKISIGPKISDNITLSTMHGCPSNEIEQIGEYLITEKKLNTAIKLNPTLLGKDELLAIMKKSGFETQVPDIAFEHDLKYEDALKIIRNLQALSDKQNLQFSIKLTNTLESNNHKKVFPENESMMYMSGRALHPIAINLAHKLQTEFRGKLDISFSGGANAFNINNVVSSGLYPVTVCTDLLKPGGYGRLHQYIEELRKTKTINSETESLKHLQSYSKETLFADDYKKQGFINPSIKTSRELKFFDCIYAPCEDTCPTNQDIPNYMYHTAKGDFEKAAEIILATNPFPNSTGMVCDHICQNKCTRINYDGSLLIREIKRFVAENSSLGRNQNKIPNQNKIKTAIIGAGPSGLSCAYFLLKAGFDVTIYESKSNFGGMVSDAIPAFRITNEAINIDVNSIIELGAKIKFNQKIDSQLFEEIRTNNNFVYISVGAQKSKKLFSDTDKYSDAVLDPLHFLFKVKKGESISVGNNVIIIGGGNTAMDTARTAFRLVGKTGKVQIIYRRTIKQMPADTSEIQAVLDEGIEILELTDPIEIIEKTGNEYSIVCRKMKLGNADSSGRAKTTAIANSEFILKANTIIPAIGQDLDIDFIDIDKLETNNGSYETKLPNIFIGGDALRGASTAINAIGDGRKAAQEIINKAEINYNTREKFPRKEKDFKQHIIDKATLIKPQQVIETDIDNRKNFNLVSSTLTKNQAIAEASRCLLCNEVCNICTLVCPNLALSSYTISPVKYQLQKLQVINNKIQIVDDKLFEVKQETQIVHQSEWCNQCGNCTTFCPSSGSPYLNKPHFYFSKTSFNNSDNGFYFDNQNNELLCKENEEIFSLKSQANNYIYSNDKFKIEIDKKDFSIINYKIKEKTTAEINLQRAAEMSVLLQMNFV